MLETKAPNTGQFTDREQYTRFKYAENDLHDLPSFRSNYYSRQQSPVSYSEACNASHGKKNSYLQQQDDIITKSLNFRPNEEIINKMKKQVKNFTIKEKENQKKKNSLEFKQKIE